MSCTGFPTRAIICPMDTGTILLMTGAFYFSAHLLAYVFQKTLIPDILILIGVGVLVGPVFGLAEVADFGRMGQVMTIIALTVILFESGTSLKASAVASCMGSMLGITIITSVLTIAVVTLGTVGLFGGDWMMALLTGAILSGTSSSVVIPMVQSLKMGERPATILIMESALTDVTGIVGAFALLNAIESGQFAVSGVLGQVSTALILATGLGLVLGILWSLAWNKIREFPDSVFSTVAFTFVIYGLAELAGASGPIAVLAFGVTLANAPLFFKERALPQISEIEQKFYREIVFVLRTFFFVFLGISVQFSGIAIFAASLVIVLIIYAARPFITNLTLSPEGTSFKEAAVTAIMLPKGLAPAVLASLVVQRGIKGGETLQALVFSVIILSIVVTAVLVPLVRKGRVRKLYSRLLPKFKEDVSL